jgi:hypothetical protein
MERDLVKHRGKFTFTFHILGLYMRAWKVLHTWASVPSSIFKFGFQQHVHILKINVLGLIVRFYLCWWNMCNKTSVSRNSKEGGKNEKLS